MFAPRLRCTKCDHLAADARPNWIERRDCRDQASVTLNVEQRRSLACN
jgi:hypothetical protein